MQKQTVPEKSPFLGLKHLNKHNVLTKEPNWQKIAQSGHPDNNKKLDTLPKRHSVPSFVYAEFVLNGIMLNAVVMNVVVLF
jgi:hypothetical protein